MSEPVKRRSLLRRAIGYVWSKLGRLLRLMPLLLIVCFVMAGCKAVGEARPDPTPRVQNEINGAKSSVRAADGKLAKKPPAVPEARKDLKNAVGHLDSATEELSKVREEFFEADQDRIQAEQELQEEQARFFSYRQRRLFWWAVGFTVILGILATVGNFAPGWWSLPALFAVKIARFVLFSGIPHLVNLFVSLFKRRSK